MFDPDDEPVLTPEEEAEVNRIIGNNPVPPFDAGAAWNSVPEPFKRLSIRLARHMRLLEIEAPELIRANERKLIANILPECRSLLADLESLYGADRDLPA